MRVFIVAALGAMLLLFASSPSSTANAEVYTCAMTAPGKSIQYQAFARNSKGERHKWGHMENVRFSSGDLKYVGHENDTYISLISHGVTGYLPIFASVIDKERKKIRSTGLVMRLPTPPIWEGTCEVYR
jgi:hypothetical protein